MRFFVAAAFFLVGLGFGAFLSIPVVRNVRFSHQIEPAGRGDAQPAPSPAAPCPVCPFPSAPPLVPAPTAADSCMTCDWLALCKKEEVATRHGKSIPLTRCRAPSTWGNRTSEQFIPTLTEALKQGGGDVPGLVMNKVAPVHLPKTKTVIVIGKGESSQPVQKTADNLIATVNHALAWVNYSDIHFMLDWYFDDSTLEVHADFFCRTGALVVPTYFHVLGRYHMHSSVLLSRLRFEGPIYFVQLPDGPQDPLVEVWKGSRELVHSSGDLAFAWLLRRGYRKFESYGIGGVSYTDKFYVAPRFKFPKRFVQNTAGHVNHIAARLQRHNATWVRH
jgi:hypothetical protein